jgi:hypothetical protein
MTPPDDVTEKNLEAFKLHISTNSTCSTARFFLQGPGPLASQVHDEKKKHELKVSAVLRNAAVDQVVDIFVDKCEAAIARLIPEANKFREKSLIHLTCQRYYDQIIEDGMMKPYSNGNLFTSIGEDMVRSAGRHQLNMHLDWIANDDGWVFGFLIYSDGSAAHEKAFIDADCSRRSGAAGCEAYRYGKNEIHLKTGIVRQFSFKFF